jgi:hypothetical protein
MKKIEQGIQQNNDAIRNKISESETCKKEMNKLVLHLKDKERNL